MVFNISWNDFSYFNNLIHSIQCKLLINILCTQAKNCVLCNLCNKEWVTMENHGTAFYKVQIRYRYQFIKYRVHIRHTRQDKAQYLKAL